MNERAAVNEVRVAVYARVSSERQADKDLSIPAQLKALRQFADKQGWRVVEQFVDEAESARTADRPEFQKMIALAKQKNPPFAIILVWKLSRFARNREHSILYKAMLRKHGVKVVSINEPIDDSPAGRMLEGMIEVVDEFYSANLSVDTVRGMNENASRGFLNGGRAPYGYRRVKVKIGEAEKAKLEADPAHAPIVKRVFQMCLDGMGVKEIAKKLNAQGYKTRDGKQWTNTVLYYMLTNETYTGVTIFNGYRYWDTKGDKTQKTIRVEGTHPALATKEQFERVRQMLKARSPLITHPRAVSSEYLLSGLAYCGSCGAKMIGTTAKGGKFFYYGCQSYLKKGREACKTGLISRMRLEDAVMEQLKGSVITDDNLSALVNLVNEEVNRERRSVKERVGEVEGQLKGLNGRLDRLYVALETGHVDMADLGPRIKALREQIENTEESKREILATEAAPLRFSGAEVRRYVDDLRELLADGTLMERKSWLRTWVKRVSIDRKRGGTIEYKLPLAALKQESRPTRGGSLDAVLSIDQIGCPSLARLEPGRRARTRLSGPNCLFWPGSATRMEQGSNQNSRRGFVET
jgi:site-specific DNA recombinase